MANNNTCTIDKVVSGYWLTFCKERAYGGPEEGGWWYDCGTLMSAIPAERNAKLTFSLDDNGDPVDFDSDDVVVQFLYHGYAAKPLVQRILERYLIKIGKGQYDEEYTNTNPHHASLVTFWSDTIYTHYPQEIPHYE